MNVKNPSQRPVSCTAAFTLIELSLVVLVLGLLAAAALRYASMQSDANNNQAVNATMDAVEAALLNYRTLYGRLPCPALIASAENTSAFGTEVGTAGDGTCGGTSGGLFFNSVSGNDPDGPSPYATNVSADSTSSQTAYDSSTMSQVAAGAIPTKTLGLADKYAYDPWGRKILYAVDIRITAANAFAAYPVYSSTSATTIGAIVIKNIGTSTSCTVNTSTTVSTACLSAALTTKAIYALVSFGANGHGGYMRNPSSTSTIYNAGSANTDELNNCHCDSSALIYPNGSAVPFNRIFVQKPKTPSTTPGMSFDDIVRFKTRPQMATASELQ